MWAKVAQWIAQFLLVPLLKDVAIWLKQHFQRKLEQRKRHAENKKKVENYEHSSSSDSSDDFTKLP